MKDDKKKRLVDERQAEELKLRDEERKLPHVTFESSEPELRDEEQALWPRPMRCDESWRPGQPSYEPRDL